MEFQAKQNKPITIETNLVITFILTLLWFILKELYDIELNGSIKFGITWKYYMLINMLTCYVPKQLHFKGGNTAFTSKFKSVTFDIDVVWITETRWLVPDQKLYSCFEPCVALISSWHCIRKSDSNRVMITDYSSGYSILFDESVSIKDSLERKGYLNTMPYLIQ